MFNFRKSIYFRAKRLVEKYQKSSILSSHKITTDLTDVSMELLTTFETIKCHHKSSNILIDIGAHKGLFAKTANAFLPLHKTWCIEPNVSMNEEIKKNNSGKIIDIFNVALSDKKGKSTYYLHHDTTMNSIVEADSNLLKEKFPWDNPNEMQKTEVDTITLDDLISKQKTTDKDVFLLKIDTQGNELNILRNGLETLKRTEICVIEQMFLNPYKTTYSFIDLILFMKEQNFECKGAMTISKRPTHEISSVDFIFVKIK